jgi:hypothetical protein
MGIKIHNIKINIIHPVTTGGENIDGERNEAGFVSIANNKNKITPQIIDNHKVI